MWKYLVFVSLFHELLAAPLQLSSLITLRTPNAPSAGGGNTPPPPPYAPLILEEWNSNTLVQEWTLPCTLPGLSTETWTEGRLSSRYPWGDQVWVLCRNVPANSSFNTNPAPVSLVYLDEQGNVGTWAEESFYLNGTNAVNIIPYWDETQSLNVFYMLGGGTLANGPTSPAKPAQARLRVDSGQGTPPDVQGGLLASVAGVTINQLRILNNTLFGMGTYGGSATNVPATFLIGSVGVLPEAARTSSTTIPITFPVFSIWTDPFQNNWWFTSLNRTGYLGHMQNGVLQEYPLPPSASAGTLGGVSWSIATARQESPDFALYMTNKSHIVKNTLSGLQNGLPYQTLLQAPPGWRYLSAYARSVVPSASPTPSSSATATSSPSATSSASATPTTSSFPTQTSSASPSASASATITGRPSSTATYSYIPQTPTASSSASPSATSSSSSTSTPSATSTSSNNNTIPYIPPDANSLVDEISPGGAVGITFGTILGAAGVSLLLLRFVPGLRSHFVRFFGMSSQKFPKNLPKRKGAKAVISGAPIEISQNPFALAQQRIDQLRNLQKNNVDSEMKRQESSRQKKQFAPTQTTTIEIRIPTPIPGQSV